MGLTCLACGGNAHPASGCQYSETAIVCGPCTRAFWQWLRRHTKPRKGTDFYGAAARWSGVSEMESTALG